MPCMRLEDAIVAQCNLRHAGVGGITLLASDAGLVSLEFSGPAQPLAPLDSPLEVLDSPHHPILLQTIRELSEYFQGRRREFQVPFAYSVGTPFQRRIWDSLKAIPYGEVFTYAELALHANSPKAFRAAGQANGRNPVSIIIPCHRVVASTGIGGYTSGIERKIWLMRREGIPIPKDALHLFL